jgi:Holliday junction resolvasome RuvABC endonuclease subunit
MTRIMSIDPGVSGALALICNGHLWHVEDMPLQAGGSTVSGRGVADFIKAWNPDIVVMEAVHCNGQNGSKANWSLGHAKGTVEGVVESLRHPLVMMSPQEWKKLAGLTGKTKNDSRALAQALWPQHYDKFKRVKDDGRAEAALIGRSYVMKMVREHNEENADAS